MKKTKSKERQAKTGGTASPFADGRQRKSSRFVGNGLSRTAMLFKIALVAGHKLTVTEMNRFKEINPRSLERVYDEVVRVNDADNARFALSLLLKTSPLSMKG